MGKNCGARVLVATLVHLSDRTKCGMRLAAVAMPTGAANQIAAATIAPLTTGATRPATEAAQTMSHAIAGSVGMAYLT